MGAFDENTITIRDVTWDESEHVVIRELSYGDFLKLQNAMFDDVTIGQSQDKVMREQIKVGSLKIDRQQLMKMEACIVSWSFNIDGKPIPVTMDNIRKLGSKYGQFISAKIAELNPERDSEFRDENEAGV